MKTKIKITTLLLALSVYASAQINVGDSQSPTALNHGGDLSKEDVDEFKKNTTVCVLQDKDKGKLADYQKAASQVWTLNKIEFTTQSDYQTKYAGKPGYSFIMPAGVVHEIRGSSGVKTAESSASFFLDFWYPYEKKGKTKRKTIARVDLYLDPSTTGELIYGNDKKEDKSNALVSDKSVFYNLTPGYMKCYLAIVNKYLKDVKTHYLFAEETDEALLKKLSRDTLFLPDFIKLGSGLATGKVRDEKELLEKYEYKYKLLSNDELSAKILNAAKPTFVFSYIYFSSQKFLAIYESFKGSIVFSSYESMSLKGLNDGDFKDISKKITKSKN